MHGNVCACIYSLHITKFILNNAHCTHCLACSAATEQSLELHKRCYLASLSGVKAIGLVMYVQSKLP